MAKKIRVLIADDSPEARDGLEAILRAYPDLEVVGPAADGSEAISKARQLRPSIVLMDIQMPGMDGLEATRRIKAQLPEIKLLLLTVHAEHIEAAMSAGADGFLMKDCTRRELIQEVRRLGRQL